MIMDMNKISSSSPISIGVLVFLVTGAFGLFSYMSPKMTMVSTNNVEIQGTIHRVDKIESAQDKYNEYFLKISASLSEIKGHLKGMEERRKGDD